MDEKILDKALMDFGYRRAKKNIYIKSANTSEVEHFIYFQITGIGESTLLVDYGLRDPIADPFSFDCTKRYGHPLTGHLRFDNMFDCSMRFNVSHLSVPFDYWHVFIPDSVDEEIMGAVRDMVRFKLLPLVKPVQNSESFYELLCGDDPRCGWLPTRDRPHRLAQTIIVGFRLGYSREMVVSALENYRRYLTEYTNTVEISEFVDLVLADWEKAKIKLR